MKRKNLISSLAMNADKIINGQCPEWDPRCFIHVNMEGRSVADNIHNVLGNYYVKEQDSMVMIRTNKGRIELSSAIERYYSSMDSSATHAGGILNINRKFCFTKNDYELDVYNNQVLLLNGVHDTDGALMDNDYEKAYQASTKPVLSHIGNIPKDGDVRIIETVPVSAGKNVKKYGHERVHSPRLSFFFIGISYLMNGVDHMSKKQVVSQ